MVKGISIGSQDVIAELLREFYLSFRSHGGAHVLGHRHGQGPDGGRLIDHHQHLPLCLQALVDLTQPVLVVG